jgi:prepilin-type N-terminal cleavage/methylation domain-containing protein
MKKADNRSGFTMVEIIAVLVIIGIMAAVAAPKFINMAEEARAKAAVSGISEAKATLSVAYSKNYLANNGVTASITGATVHNEAFGSSSGISTNFGDVAITTAITGNDITITATSLDGTAIPLADQPSDIWTVPEN